MSHQVAVAELTEAREKLRAAEEELGTAKAALVAVKDGDDAQQIVKAEAGVAEAKLGVAKAELGVAKAEVGVAEAKVGVAKAEWQAATDDEKAAFKVSFETAQDGVKTALESVRTAQKAYNGILDAAAPPHVLHARYATKELEVFVSDGVKGKLAKRVPLPSNGESMTPGKVIASVSQLFGAECRFVCEVQKSGLQVELPKVLRGGEELTVEYRYWDLRLEVSSVHDSVRSTIATLARSRGLDGFCSRSHAVKVYVAVFSVNKGQITDFVSALPNHLVGEFVVHREEWKEGWGVLQGHFIHHKGGVARDSGNSPDNESGTSGATGLSASAMSMYT